MGQPEGVAIQSIVGYEAGARALTRRRGFEETELSDSARQGIREFWGEDLSADEVVARILAQVRTEGDPALYRLTEALDRATVDHLEIPRSAWEAAFQSLTTELQESMTLAAEQIERFHRHQIRTSWVEFDAEGALGQLIRPLERVGIYAPGGSAAYPSSLLMAAVPARVAGVSEIIVCSPPTGGTVSPLVLAAAHVAGVDRLFQVGGAQAIGAMAYGTAEVPHVDKIFGPGNIFVVLAKKQVYGVVAIDQLPGPTETLIVADDSADPIITAADMLAQAEHDPMASAILVTTSPVLAEAVRNQLDLQVPELPRSAIVRASLGQNGAIVVVDTLEQAIDLANRYAPEHLCLLIENPWSVLDQVKHAGGVFLGESSPESLGDYTAGPSHVMPTGGTARFFSPIHVGDFTKVISVIGANAKAVDRLGPATMALAHAEGLDAHATAIRKRLERRA